PERSGSARSSLQLSRFYHSLNPDRVFGTHNDVKLVLDGVGLDDRRILQRYVSVRAFDHEARGGKLQGAARPHQKGDVAAGLQHPAAQISANGPGANDENAHLSIPLAVV